ncbi:L-serine ammonia-lyase, iron-sulfur-dependent, subunit alpha [Clostridium sp. HV4-5-A1G]|jgi:L-serine dehydratase|uniref:L-serine ammonia-lyase, iron-sulfur-dependent, subunit alpha n=1 Tax=Clostridium sp. HV4-5-A1G TaxID=2004595 RepID=UPI00123992A7|nr:L-serine ammonia-lyase, iron-sulfur-dependent, subunit alpha [Clostridium sp. HV4-5-A1G]KAA8670501.1 L-serine ammonia-lyase, iron-sulfur-dependent, subunit alpha [Clostridium sp. HV4-5-A1G]CAB1251210.1 L-serine dehydratase (alpha chain) [Clostridiaceae bacterium BL-3]
MVNTGKELIDICQKKNMKIWEYTIEQEAISTEKSKEDIFKNMKKSFQVMKDAAECGVRHKVKSVSGLIGGDAYKLNEYCSQGKTLTGTFMVKAMARALSCSEINAAMGKIVAAPTAGSCGIIPATIITAGEKLNKSEDELIQSLFTATGIGIIIAKNATMAGAEGGCQAECGSASAMASAGVVEMMGGTPQQALNASAIVIKNILGLVCDPVAGLVEIPCAMRNASGAVNALTTADMVMAGVISRIPFDDTVSAMYKVGKQLPCELRETALGGLAITETGLKLKRKVLGK